MIGYKGFDSDLACLGFQYKVGKTYHLDNEMNMILCVRGFHFCRYSLDVLLFYGKSSDRYAIVRADGNIDSDDNKYVTDKITILEEITQNQLSDLMPNYLIRQSGQEEWYHKGLLHRNDGPALITPKFCSQWYHEGRRHRSDGPAVEYIDGGQRWYLNGQLHRDEQPAIIHPDGRKDWFYLGQRHCVNGPAIIYASGYQEYYINGEYRQ